MDADQRLYYGLGQLCYAVALADGAIQHEEKQKLHDIVLAETKNDIDFDYSDIIFQLLERSHMDREFSYKAGMKDIRLCSHHLTPERRELFSKTLSAVAAAFDSVTKEESEMLQRFNRELSEIK